MAKKKFYAISAGHIPGIYTSWPEAQAQIRGFSGAVYKGFATRDEAAAWLKNPSYTSSANRKTARKQSAAAAPKTSPRAGEISIYTDGGSINNPGPGGYGVVIVDGQSCREFSGGFSR